MSDHLRDPLDYLYEELASEGMAEVRRHLSECPDCRADMRAVRETVKAYRRAAGPTVPDGLAVRAAMKALEAARAAEAEAVAPAPTPAPAPAPAPVAPAPVPVVAAPVDPAPPRAPAIPAQSLEKVTEGLEQVLRIEQSRVSQETLEKEYKRIREDVLGEMEQKSWRTWLFHPAWTVAAGVVFVCALLIHISPRMNRMDTFQPQPALSRNDASTRQIRERERLPAAAPKQREFPAPIPAEAPIVLREAEAMNEPPALPPPVAAPAAARPAQARLAAPAPRMAPDVVVPAAAPMATPAPAPAPEAPPPVVTQTAADDAGSAEADETASVPEPVPPRDAAILTESLEEFLPEAAAAGDGAAPVIVDMLQMEPPQLIERPTPINVPERIQTLTTLAGMQMANGEFEDAWESVRLLEAYDKDAARNLAAVLTGMEQAAAAKQEAEAEVTESTAPAAEPEAVPEAVAAPEPEATPEPTRELETLPPPDPAPAEPAVPAPEPEPAPVGIGATEDEVFRPLSPSPVAKEPMRRRALEPAAPPPPLPSVAAAEPDRSPVALMDGWVASPQAIAAAPSPDPAEMIPAPAHPHPDVAVETVLWVQEPVILHEYTPPTASRKPSPKRTPFSTDPYVRGY